MVGCQLRFSPEICGPATVVIFRTTMTRPFSNLIDRDSERDDTAAARSISLAREYSELNFHQLTLSSYTFVLV